MPSRKFALEREGPKRLELSWSAMYKNFQVKLDGSALHDSPVSKDELRAGKEQRVPKRQAESGGKPVPGAAHASGSCSR